MSRLVFPVLLIIFGIVYITLTLNLQKSNIGDPNSPMYFPMLLGILLTVMSCIYFIQEYRKRHLTFKAFFSTIRKSDVYSYYLNDYFSSYICFYIWTLRFPSFNGSLFRRYYVFNQRISKMAAKYFSDSDFFWYCMVHIFTIIRRKSTIRG